MVQCLPFWTNTGQIMFCRSYLNACFFTHLQQTDAGKGSRYLAKKKLYIRWCILATLDFLLFWTQKTNHVKCQMRSIILSLQKWLKLRKITRQENSMGHWQPNMNVWMYEVLSSRQPQISTKWALGSFSYDLWTRAQNYAPVDVGTQQESHYQPKSAAHLDTGHVWWWPTGLP